MLSKLKLLFEATKTFNPFSNKFLMSSIIIIVLPVPGGLCNNKQLDFELFKPEAEQPLDFYAAKPITIKAKATYHQFSSFVSGVAALPRIVTLENVTLAAVGAAASKNSKPAAGAKNEAVDIQATLQTYRYMDEGSAPARATPRKGAGAAKK